MRLLLLGYSNIARRRVLPAARQAGFTHLDLACRSGLGERPAPSGLDRLYGDYEEAIDASEADLVYISTTNERHAPLARRAIDRGLTVVVDKPAALDLADVEDLCDQAQAAGVCLAEANVWGSHPQVKELQRAFAEAGSAPRQLLASFSFPPLPHDNIRMRAALGGGALWDLGPYAVSPGRIFFGGEPEVVHGAVLARGEEVDTAFSAHLVYPGGRSLVAQMGFCTGYSNRLELLGPGLRVEVERVFTPPPDFASTLRRHGPGGSTSEVQPPASTFRLFLEEVLEAARSGQSAGLRDAMRTDHRTLARLRVSAQAPSPGAVGTGVDSSLS